MVYVLHVDDSKEDRTLTGMSMKRVSDDIQLLEAESGASAIKIMESGEKVDCIISDYQMPGMNGMELLLNLREKGFTTPFILLTGQGNENVAVEALRKGADDYFTKEVGFASYSRLINTIQNVVEKYQQMSRRREAEEKALIFKTISDKANIGNAIGDIDGKIIYANLAFTTIHGFEQEDIKGVSLKELQLGEASLLDELKEQTHLDAVEVWHRTRDGSVVNLLINASIVADDLNEPRYISINAIDITQRKKDEEALKSNKERLRDLMDHVNDIIYTHDLDGNFTSVNHAIKKVLGYSENEIVGKNLQDIVHPRYVQLIFKEIEKEKQGRRFRRNNEILLYDKQGNKKFVEVNFRLVRKGNLSAEILGIARDITDKRHALKRIKEAREQYKELVEKAGIAILIDSIEGGFEYFNDEFTEIFGYSKEEIIDMSIADLVHPDDYTYVINYHNRRLAGEKSPSRYEFRGVTKEGKTIYLEVDAVPRIRDGQFVGTRSYLWDITERKMVEQEAQKHKAYFETLIENAPEAIVIHNSDGTIAKTNYEFSKTFGYSREEAVGKQIDSLITPADFHKESKMLSQMIFEEGRVYAETERETKDGRHISVSILGAPIEIDNRLEGHYSIFRDITEKKRTEEELEKYRLGLEKQVAKRTAELYEINKELEKSREQYKLLAENVNDNIFILDLSTRKYSYSSPSVKLITGFTPEEVTRMRLVDLFSRDSYLKVKRLILRELRSYRESESPSMESYIVELQHARKAGGYVWVEVTGRLLCDNNGVPDRVLCSMRDISERKRNQEIIRATEERFKTIIEESPYSILICQVDGRIIRANPAAARLFGLARDALELMYYDELTYPEDVGLEDRDYDALLKGEISNYFIEKRYTNKSEKPFWARLSVSMIRDDKGNPLDVIAMIEDINERKEAEQELASSRKKYKDLVDLLPQTVFETDIQGNITFVNRGGMETFGYTQEMIDKGVNVREIIVPEEHEKVFSNVKRIAGGHASKGNSYTAVRADGSLFSLLLFSVGIFEDGKAVGLRGVGVDVSDLHGFWEKYHGGRKEITSLFENDSDAVILFEKESGLVSRCNLVAESFIESDLFKQFDKEYFSFSHDPLQIRLSKKLNSSLKRQHNIVNRLAADDDSPGYLFSFSNINFSGVDSVLVIIKNVARESEEL